MLHTRVFTFNPLGTNCVVLWEDGQKACTVVDPGMSSPDGAQELEDFFDAHELTPDAILLTHGHFDHVWGVGKLLARYRIPVYLHPEDVDIMDRTTGASAMQSFSFLKHDFPTVPLADGDVITTAGTAWTVIHTPGHTPGSVCYYSARNNLLLSGDTLFQRSIGRTDLHGGSMMQIIQSLRLLAQLHDETLILPGHGPSTTMGDELRTNPFLDR